MFKHGKLKKFVALIILDGWGGLQGIKENKRYLIKTPQFDKLIETYPTTLLKNSLDISRSSTNDYCRLTHYTMGTSIVENDISQLEKINPLKVNSLSRILSKNNLKQLYLTDSEKFPQLAYFFRGCYSKVLKGEERILIENDISKDPVKNPQNILKKISLRLKKELESRKYNFIVINLSSADLASSTNSEQIIKKTFSEVDKCLGDIVEKILNWGGEAVVVADHSVNIDFENHKENANNYVPFIFVSSEYEGQSFSNVKMLGTDLSQLKSSGYLADIAPTILKILNIKKPIEISGKSLI